jgi:hypothetical protein
VVPSSEGAIRKQQRRQVKCRVIRIAQIATHLHSYLFCIFIFFLFFFPISMSNQVRKPIAKQDQKEKDIGKESKVMSNKGVKGSGLQIHTLQLLRGECTVLVL